MTHPGMRAHKRRTVARVLYRARIWAPDRFDVDWHSTPDDDGPEGDPGSTLVCSLCGRYLDPSTDDCAVCDDED